LISHKESYPSLNLLADWKSKAGKRRRYIYWLCVFGFVMAALELGQDVVSSTLNGNHFRLTESLSYKLFWLLFVPFSILQAYLLRHIESRFSGIVYAVCNALSVVAVTLIHLITFSLFLFAISNLIHYEPWQLSILITEKLSTRLYIGLSIYILFSVAYFFLSKQAPVKNSARVKEEPAATIAVKTGQNTILVDVDKIQWITSDGPYLYLCTADKKHVILDSLKHIITTLPENFRRIHRSTIINVEEIKELQSRGNGDYDIITENGRVLRLSRNYAKPLKRLLL